MGSSLGNLCVALSISVETNVLECRRSCDFETNKIDTGASHREYLYPYIHGPIYVCI